MKTKIVILVVLILAIAGIQAVTTRTITGTVTDAQHQPIPGVSVVLNGTTIGTVTDVKGKYSITIPQENGALSFSFLGYTNVTKNIGASQVINVVLAVDNNQLNEVVVVAAKRHGHNKDARGALATSPATTYMYSPSGEGELNQPVYNTEEYDKKNENIFLDAMRNPLSTFSIDVDAASYSNVRRFINGGQLPPADAVRIEEMVNYFHYNYSQPGGDDPFAIHTEIATAPWNPKHQLISIGLQGKTIPTDHLPASNLVFLIDVSGSMGDPNKLPLLVSSFKMLVQKLRDEDRIAIVVYAGAAGLVLPSTAGSDKKTIIDALDQLQAGGSTAGGEGIELAYAVAKKNFRLGGNNRVILATDGDFNVGASSNGSMERLIEEKRNDGIFLTVLGFGMGNYKDSKMEILADKGNGNYAYIDGIQEARKVLINEFGGTLFTIAKDVKLQIEFNPAKVKAYRLIGYENRMLKSEDFNNDKKDAGDLGSGHTVTALYEIIPVGVDSEFFKVDGLKYQASKVDPSAFSSNEIMTVKFRYKQPTGDVSKLIVHPLQDGHGTIENASENLRWASAAAGFGMLLQGSEYCKGFSTDDVLKLAKGARGVDEEGYRVEFINLVSASKTLGKL
jgi:Ca-activated chloride channel homolog